MYGSLLYRSNLHSLGLSVRVWLGIDVQVLCPTLPFGQDTITSECRDSVASGLLCFYGME